MPVSNLTSRCGKLYGSSNSRSEYLRKSESAASSPLQGLYLEEIDGDASSALYEVCSIFG
jgi:hypothetical protein